MVGLWVGWVEVVGRVGWGWLVGWGWVGYGLFWVGG